MTTTLTLSSTLMYIGIVFIFMAIVTAVAEHLDRKDARRRRDERRRRQRDMNKLSHLNRDWWMT